jgi:hypothetical protein
MGMDIYQIDLIGLILLCFSPVCKVFMCLYVSLLAQVLNSKTL